MTDKPDITEDEMRNSMNFDQVLTLAQAAILKNQRRARRIKNTLYTAGIFAVGLTVYWFLQPAERTAPPEFHQPANPSPAEPVKDIPIISAAPEADKTQNVKEEKFTGKAGPLKTTATIKISADSVRSPYIAAEPVRGFPDLYEYFNRELKYPEDAVKEAAQGVITVNFIVDKNGQPRDPEFVNSLGPAFDKEAQRLIQNMPPWKPALLNGEPVGSKISIPLTFQIKTVKQPR